MSKSRIRLSLFGTVAERADVIVFAPSKSEAEDKALAKSEAGEVDFTNENESVDGWTTQVEECTKIG